MTLNTIIRNKKKLIETYEQIIEEKQERLKNTSFINIPKKNMLKKEIKDLTETLMRAYDIWHHPARPHYLTHKALQSRLNKIRKVQGCPK